MMRTYITMLIVIILIASIGVDSFAEQRQVRVAGDPYPPWTEGAVGSKASGGIVVEIVEELFRRLDMSTLVVVYPFKRGLERIKQGEEDVILMVSRSTEREHYMLFTDPIRYVQHVFYYTDELDDFDWSDWEDLKPYAIGNVTGYNLGDEWQDAVKRYDLHVEEVKADDFNIRKLLLGRIDLAIADNEVMQRVIEQNPNYQGKLFWHKKPVFESLNNLGISKKSFLAPMLHKINVVLQEMKDDGTFQRIFCAHGKRFQGSCDES